jgi:hypothetical protein
MDEFALVTGETITLFFDRKDIRWGEEWRRRIDASLAETTFFIPIITPLYFKRPECRRELLNFVGQARSLGALELVMPILYVDVPGLTDESTDEACALVARMQYVDWRQIRLMSEDSPEYRQGVNSLAVRLAEIADRYEQQSSLHESEDKAVGHDYLKQTAEEVTAAEEEEKEGLLDIIAEVEPRIVAWKEIIDDVEVLNRQKDILVKEFAERMQKAERSGFPSGAQLNLIRAYCKETEPLERRSLEKTKTYSSTAVELDPLILSLIREINSYPEFIDNLPSPLISIEDVYKELRNYDAKHGKKIKESRKVLNRYKGMSKDLARLGRLVEIEDRLIDDGNSILYNWHEEIQKYLEGSSSRSIEAQEIIDTIQSFLTMTEETSSDIGDNAESSVGSHDLPVKNDGDDSVQRLPKDG